MDRIKINFRLSLALAIVFISLSTTAQNQADFYSGITGGLNASNMIFAPTITQKTHWGYDAGIIFRADVISFAGLWLEVDYSSRGWTEKNEDHPDLKYSRTLNYINIPFMTHFRIGKKALKFTIDVGPHFGYFISESSSSTYQTEEEKNTVITKQHDMPVENKFAWALGGGPGIEYHLKKQIIGLRMSYCYGLGEIYGNKRKDFFGKSSEQIYSAKIYYLYKF